MPAEVAFRKRPPHQRSPGGRGFRNQEIPEFADDVCARIDSADPSRERLPHHLTQLND